jgi:cold shock CspA family protein
MDGVSRRGLFGLIGGLGGAALGSSTPSFAQTAVPTAPQKRLDLLRRTPVDDDAEVFETFGRFEWFNLEDRYGFVREVGSDRRILLHVACLKAAGIWKIPADAVIRCEVLRRPKGWQAFRIIDVIESAA